MKTKEELNAIKTEVETLSKKLAELTEEELAQVSGGAMQSIGMKINSSSDDPSGYQISERMRVQIRSRDQANFNPQNEK